MRTAVMKIRGVEGVDTTTVKVGILYSVIGPLLLDALFERSHAWLGIAL